MDITVDDIVIEKLGTHSKVFIWSGFDYQDQFLTYWMNKQLNQMNLSWFLRLKGLF